MTNISAVPAVQQLLPSWPIIGKITTAIQTAQLAHSLYNQVWGVIQTRRANQSYSITVKEDDVLYAEVQRWILANTPKREHRALTAKVEYRHDDDYDDYDTDNGPSGGRKRLLVTYWYDSSEWLRVVLDGQAIDVGVVKQDRDSTDEMTGARTSVLVSEQKIRFVARDRRGIVAVQGLLEQLNQSRLKAKHGPRLFTSIGWGNWRQSKGEATRKPESVVLADGQMERLLGDLQGFLDSELDYVKLGVPFHRGYLLYGPPGTGKTSVARAMATAMGLDLYSLSLSDIEGDAKLVQIVSSIPERAILLLEDIDVSHAAVSREDTGLPKLTASGLLNALDGVSTPHGLITIMTTNNVELLDEALVREGRCDVKEKIDYLTDEQAARLVAMATGITGPLPALNGRRITPSQLVEVIKQRISDKAAAHRAVVAFLRERDQEAAA